MNHAVGFVVGISVGITGLLRALTNRATIRGYLWFLAVLALLTLITSALGIWGVVTLTHGAESEGFIAVGLFAARFLGILVVLFMSPLLVVLTATLLLPPLADRPFFAALRVLRPRLSSHLEKSAELSLRNSIGFSARRLGLTGAMGLFCLALGFLPVIGPALGVFLQLLTFSMLTTWELLDPYWGRANIGYREQKSVLVENFGAALGFGLINGLLLSTPFVGPLFFGLSQAATAEFVVRILYSGESPT